MIIRIPNNPVFSFSFNTRPRMHKGDEILAISFLGRYMGINGLRFDNGVEIVWGKI